MSTNPNEKIAFNRRDGERIARTVRAYEGSTSRGRNPQRVHKATDLVSTIPVKLTARTDDTTYTGDIYEYGIDASATIVDATIKLLNSDGGGSLVGDDYYLAVLLPWDGGSGNAAVNLWTLIYDYAADRYFAVNGSDAPDYGENQFADYRKEADSTGPQYGAADDLLVYGETIVDTGDRLIRLHVDDPTDGGAYGLEMVGGKLHVSENRDPAGDNTGSSRGINKTFWAQSDSASFDLTVDDTVDYRGRHIECWLELTSLNDSTAPTVGEKFLKGSLSSDVTLVSDSPYSVVVDSSDGSLHITASASSLYTAVVWIRASAPYSAPLGCPCSSWPGTSGVGWPCGGLVEEYEYTNNLVSEYDSAVIASAYYFYTSTDGSCSGSLVDGSHEYRFKANSTIQPYTTSCIWQSEDFVTLEFRSKSAGTWSAWSDVSNYKFVMGLSGGIWYFNIVYDNNLTGSKSVGATPVGQYDYQSCVYEGPEDRKKIISLVVTEAT